MMPFDALAHPSDLLKQTLFIEFFSAVNRACEMGWMRAWVLLLFLGAEGGHNSVHGDLHIVFIKSQKCNCEQCPKYLR